MPQLTAAQYAELGADAHAALVGIITTVVRPASGAKGLVFNRDPVNLDESQWLGALRSSDDADENGDKRVHAWVIKFGGDSDLMGNITRSIEPTWEFPVEVFYSHDFGTDADNSEKRIRDEVLKVQWALAERTKLDVSLLERHTQLHMRLRLAKLGGVIVHRGQGSVSVNVTSLQAY